MKLYYEMYNVGKAKYVVNYHDGQSTHGDGSPFWYIAIFQNKRHKQVFIRQLIARGYQERSK